MKKFLDNITISYPKGLTPRELTAAEKSVYVHGLIFGVELGIILGIIFILLGFLIGGN